MTKTRKPFILLDCNSKQIGHGVAYAENNVQVFMHPHNTAWQMQLSDVLSIKGVRGFQWADKTPSDAPQQPFVDASVVDNGNEVWNRIDGVYDPKEFGVKQ